MEKMNGKVDCDSATSIPGQSTQDGKTKPANEIEQLPKTLCYSAIGMATVATILSIYSTTQINKSTNVMIEGGKTPLSAAVIGAPAVFSAVQNPSGINAAINFTDADYTEIINELQLTAATLTEIAAGIAQDTAILEEKAHYLKNKTDNLKLNASKLTNQTFTLSQHTTALNTTIIGLSKEVAEYVNETEVLTQENIRIAEDTLQLNITLSVIANDTVMLAKDTAYLTESTTNLSVVATNLNSTTTRLLQKTENLTNFAEELNENTNYNRGNITYIVNDINTTTVNLTESVEAGREHLGIVGEVFNVTVTNLTEATERTQRMLVEFVSAIEEERARVESLNQSYTTLELATEIVVFECEGFIYRGSCYWVGTQLMTYADANAECARRNGHLAYMTIHYQQDTLSNRLRTRGTPLILWLGASYDHSALTFTKITFDNGVMAIWSKWRNSYPTSNPLDVRVLLEIRDTAANSQNGILNAPATDLHYPFCQTERP